MSKSVLITGGAGGIGFACAEEFKDCHVIIAGLNEKELSEAVDKLKSENIYASYIVADITNKEDVDEMYKFAVKGHDLVAVINSAGVSGADAPKELIYDVDVKGAKLVLDGAYENLSSGGVLILITSMMHKIINLDPQLQKEMLLCDDNAKNKFMNYNDDPNILYALAKKINVELVNKNSKAFGIKNLRIVSVSPGIILTPMAKVAMEKYPEKMKYLETVTPMGRMGKPIDIAKTVKFLTTDGASFITGSTIHVDGGLSPIDLK